MYISYQGQDFQSCENNYLVGIFEFKNPNEVLKIFPFYLVFSSQVTIWPQCIFCCSYNYDNEEISKFTAEICIAPLQYEYMIQNNEIFLPTLQVFVVCFHFVYSFGIWNGGYGKNVITYCKLGFLKYPRPNII